jgi:hypothetical protein
VTHFLNEHALGVRPAAPGFERWVVDPSLLHIEHLSAAAGSRPTPHGPLRVSHNLTAGVLEVLSVPAGSRGELVLPFRAAHVVPVWASQHGTRACLAKMDEDRVLLSAAPAAADKVRVERTPDGALKLGPITSPISVCWDTTALTSVEEREHGGLADILTVPVAPRAVRLPLDRSTRGQWKGKYGNKGYILFNYNCSGQNTSHRQSSGLCDLSGSWVGIPGKPGVAVTQNGANFVASAAGMRPLLSKQHGKMRRETKGHVSRAALTVRRRGLYHPRFCFGQETGATSTELYMPTIPWSCRTPRVRRTPFDLFFRDHRPPHLLHVPQSTTVRIRHGIRDDC